MFGIEFKIEQISFWIGFAAATIFWWVFNYLKRQWPQIRQFIQEQIKAERERRLAGVDLSLREQAFRQAQAMHLAAAIFPLDDIVIPPTLIAPPPPVDPESPQAEGSIAQEVIPYMPGWPEIPSLLGAPRISFADATQDTNIAIIGQPGSGKTVALAYLAAEIARRNPGLGHLSERAPLLLHVLDLKLPASGDPALPLIQKFSGNNLLKSQLSSFIQHGLEDGRIVLLLDGLDELPLDALRPVSDYLKKLIETYPQIRIILAASPDCMDGLTALPITPLNLAVWRPEQIKEFVERWSALWLKFISPNIKKQTNQEPPTPYLLNAWLTATPAFLTPMEWTLRVWATYAGDLRGPLPMHGLEALIRRTIGNTIPAEALKALAGEMIQRGSASIAYQDAEKFLSKFRIQDAQTTASPIPPEAETQSETASPSDEAPSTETTPSAPKPVSKGKKLASSGSRVLDTLLNIGLLKEYQDDQVAFICPVLTGYLSTLTEGDPQPASIPEGPLWSALQAQYHYLAAQNKAGAAIQYLLQTDEPPFYPHLLAICHWLKDAPTNADWRSNIMRRIVQLLQSEDIPFNIRCRIMSGAIVSNDPAVATLSRQFMTSQSKAIRQITALVCGTMQDAKAVADLTGLFNDPEASIQAAACFALSNIPTPQAQEGILYALAQGDEVLRLAAGETLSTRPEYGHAILKQSLSSEDILVRRAAVFGIARIREPWAVTLLEQVAVEDSQWVVRNAAGQALESIQHPQTYRPVALPPPTESPWLIKFASKRGLGLNPEQSAIPMILDALKTGSLEEKIAALQYLRNTEEENVIKTIYETSYSPENQLSEAACLALWYILVSGVKLPSPTKFGI